MVSDNTSAQNFGTLAVHASAAPNAETGAVIQPISLSTTYAQTSAGVPVGEFEYSRSSNPNRDLFEGAVAKLEQAKFALAYSSGSAATSNILQSLAQGSHVVSVGDVYGGTHRYFTKVANTHGVKVSFTNKIEEELDSLITSETRLVWIESPSNPTLSVTDIAKVAGQVQIARAKFGQPLWLVVDNTFLSPYIQNPLVHGADIVVHSVSKYINGHSDVIMGVIATSSEDIHSKLRFLQNAIGAIPSPFDCWLAHRGLKTLHLRVRQSSTNALALAELLAASPLVEAVSYPGLKNHARRDVVLKQHRDGLGGGMISVRIKGDAKAADKFCQASKLFTLAESLGGIESLIEIPAVMTHAGIPAEERAASGVYDNLVRMSVGIEDTQDLIDDVLQALEVATA